MTAPLAAWLREEIRFLETGAPFTGTVSADAIGGLFLIGFEVFAAVDPQTSLDEILQGGPPDRPPSPDTVARALRRLPVSHAVFFRSVGALGLLTPDGILDHLARQDPGRYLSALVLAAGAAEDHELELGRQETRLMLLGRPGPGEPYVRSSLRIAAERFVKETGVRIGMPPFVPEQAATPEDVDAVIQATWRRLKQALRAGDIEGALTAISASKRDGYRRVFRELKDRKVDVDEVMTEIHRVKIDTSRAEYEMIRHREGEALSFLVLFVRDADGVWRLKTM